MTEGHGPQRNRGHPAPDPLITSAPPPVPGERIRDSRGHLRIEDTENAADEQPAALLTAENMQTILDRDLAVTRPAHDAMTVGQLIDDTAHKTTGRRGELESRGPATEKPS